MDLEKSLLTIVKCQSSLTVLLSLLKNRSFADYCTPEQQALFGPLPRESLVDTDESPAPLLSPSTSPSFRSSCMSFFEPYTSHRHLLRPRCVSSIGISNPRSSTSGFQASNQPSRRSSLPPFSRYYQFDSQENQVPWLSAFPSSSPKPFDGNGEYVDRIRFT